MKILVMLALLGLILGGTVAFEEVCPPRPSMSVLDTPVQNYDCDVCEKLNNPDTDFYQKCGNYLDSMILEKLIRDCKRILKSGKQAQIQWFWKDLNLICKVKSGLGSAYIEFDPPTCECDPCVELAKPSGEFMQICAPNLTQCELAQIFCQCRRVKNDYEDLWLFYQDLKEKCYELTGKNITFPLCKCDVCWLLFYETSDFMTKCGSQMSQDILNKLMSSCEKIMCDPIELGHFKLNLELICEKKLNVTFNFPQCACEECWKLFQSDSDFMQKCGSGMSNAMLMKLMETCYANMDSLDHFMAFLDDLELICHKKTSDYFEKEWCRCLDCLLIEDPTQEIWEDCIQYLSDSQKTQFRHQCLNVTNDENALQQFKQDIVDLCLADYRVHVTFPTCECQAQDLCIVFAIDASGSIDNSELGLELGFVRDVVEAFGDNIGPGKTQIGIIQFSHYVKLELSLCASADQDSVNQTIDYIQNHRITGGTDIALAINKTREDFESCCTDDNRKKFAIVLTDGWASPSATQVAVDAMPSDVKMIAIGFGGANINVLNIIARQILDNSYKVNSVQDLSSLVDDLKDEIGC